MPTGGRATRLMVFSTEDDWVGHRCAADLLLERARECGLAGATVWRGIEGFGSSGHLRSDRFPDLARGLPLVVEVIDDEARIEVFLRVVTELAPGCLVTAETVEVLRRSGKDG
jgi:PII-like signaling protein